MDNAQDEDDSNKTPRQLWGTCCPYDPECEHSFWHVDRLHRHMDTPIKQSSHNAQDENRMDEPDQALRPLPCHPKATFSHPRELLTPEQQAELDEQLDNMAATRRRVERAVYGWWP